MSEKEEAINRHFGNNKKMPNLVNVNIANAETAAHGPQFTQGALFPGKELEVTAKDTVKVVDKNTTKQMINKSNYNLTPGKYVSYMAKSHRSEADVFKEEANIKTAKKIKSGAKFGAALTAGIIGVGTVLDIGSGFNERKEIQRDLAEQEKKLARSQSQETNSMKRKSHDYVDMGEIVHEMFNERIGHYKMGNSKFQ